jgi:hypothetical protein
MSAKTRDFHSCAVALLQSGTDVTVIRDYLGHTSVATTGRYITINLQMKRDAMQAFWKKAGIEPATTKPWKAKADLHVLTATPCSRQKCRSPSPLPFHAMTISRQNASPCRGRRVPVDTVSPVVFSIALLRRYDGYTFAPRVRALKTGCADGYLSPSNGRFQNECLNEHWFVSTRHAMTLVESCRIEYNTERHRSSLGCLTPEQFARAHEATQQSLTSESSCGPDHSRGRGRPDLVDSKVGLVSIQSPISKTYR